MLVFYDPIFQNYFSKIQNIVLDGMDHEILSFANAC